MLKWSEYAGATIAQDSHHGGAFVSVAPGAGGWTIEFAVGPVGTYQAPSREKAMVFVERFLGGREGRLTDFGRSAATPGVGFARSLPYRCITTAEEQSRYDAFSASYLPPRRRPRRHRR